MGNKEHEVVIVKGGKRAITTYNGDQPVGLPMLVNETDWFNVVLPHLRNTCLKTDENPSDGWSLWEQRSGGHWRNDDTV